MTERRHLLAAAAGTALLPASDIHAQHQTLRWVVPCPPGGGTDVLGRTLAQTMHGGLGMAIVVDNKPGASTHIAAQQVARAAPGGRTVLQANNAVPERSLDLGMQTLPGTPEQFRAVARSAARRGGPIIHENGLPLG